MASEELKPDTLTENPVPDPDFEDRIHVSSGRARALVPADDWVERCERLQAELEAAKQREQKHLDMIERLSALAEEWAAEPWTKADGCHEEFQALTRAHLKENGRG